MLQALYDLTDCTSEPAADALLAAMHSTVEQLGCTVHASLPVTFVPHGTTAAFVLGESHLIVSTWPELHAAHIDLFTCRAAVEPDQAVIPILAAFGTPTVRPHRLERALPGSPIPGLPEPARPSAASLG